MAKHERVHTKEKPGMCDHCDLCGKKLPSNAKLLDHMRKIHDGIELSCRFGCGWKSMSKSMITLHEKKCDLNPVPNTPFLKQGKLTREEV